MTPHKFTHEEMIRVQIGKGIANGWDDRAKLDPDCGPILQYLGAGERCVASFRMGTATCYLTDRRLMIPKHGSMRGVPYDEVLKCYHFSDVAGDSQLHISGKRAERIILHTKNGERLFLSELGGTVSSIGSLFRWMISKRENGT